MAVQLPPDLEPTVEHYLKSDRYDTKDEVLREAFDALAEREHQRFLRLQQLVREGLEEPGRIPYTPTLLEDLQRAANERFERGERPESDLVE